MNEREKLSGPNADGNTGQVEGKTLTGPDINGDSGLADQVMNVDAAGNLNKENTIREMVVVTKNL